MHNNEQNIRLIFGLKLRQLRQDNKLSLVELSEKSGLSVSYLNEIEKGKKYPKAEKIAAISAALGVSYDKLVSLKTSKALSPVARFLENNFIQELPLEVFGIDKKKIVELVSNAPEKVTAFISTLNKIARDYDMTSEHFYFAAVRSYQEMHENYFEEIEQAVEKFRAEYKVNGPLGVDELKNIVVNKFGYNIDEKKLGSVPSLENLRSVYLSKGKRFMINNKLAGSQQAFIYAKEIGYQYLGLKERAYTTPWNKANSFEQVLSNMKASYFAGALLINRDRLVKDLKSFFDAKKFDSEKLLAMMDKFEASPEMFMHRLTNIIPRYFGLNNLFFLRFNNNLNAEEFSLSKELHLSQLHQPHRNELNEHYCRRWISIGVFQKLEEIKKQKKYKGPVVAVQRSKYADSGNEYFCITLARRLGRTPHANLSVTIGFLVNNDFKKKVVFWDDENVPQRIVNETCERCGIADCKERVAKPYVLEKQNRLREVENAVKELMEKESLVLS
ncbi:MAG: hypothetical protein POELPBGB_02399 [Bacteroidia bacterium]|nr:hypothetical protein [Bacteroidia bacterium]